MNSNIKKNITEKDKLKTIGFSSNRKLESQILKLEKENKKENKIKK